MPTEATFRFSTYLTLALACVALGYAQAPMLPEVPVFAGLAVTALGVLYFVETRVALLSIPAANRLGAVVGTAFVFWAAFRIKRELDIATAEFASLGWHMLIVAMCGPLVMLLLAAKVARDEKHAGDYWTLHGTALAGVGLAAAFAEEPLCFALVGFYLVAAVWSLTLFHLNRAAGIVAPVPNPKAPPARIAATSAEPHGARSGFRAAILWATSAGAVAVPLYLLTPRSQAMKADFGKPRIEIGYSAGQMVDLNLTGPLATNDETAFEVTAKYPDGTPKTDLDPGQRWRGRTHHQYARGAWSKDQGRLPNIYPIAKTAVPWVPPNLGPGQFSLEFTVPPLAPQFVADPIVWLPNEPVPLSRTTEDRPRGWTASFDGTFYMDREQTVPTRPVQYVQAYHRGPDPDLGPGFQLTGALLDDTLRQLCDNPVERVKKYADKLVIDLIDAGKLPSEWRDPATLRDPRRRLPREAHHDRLAKAFAAHLATTPELQYTTDLRRENLQVDPIEDFLYHSKAGHCERFATALVLMLRSQGIPAVLVLGFKGCEHVGDGRYLVKQESAHAWVEALVSMPIPAAEHRPGGPDRHYHWRSLDPTPGGESTNADTNGARRQQANSWIGERFRQYFVNYTPEQRRKKLAAFVNRVTRLETLLALAVAIALLLVARMIVRRRAVRAAEPPPPAAPTRWFGELVAVLNAHGITHGSGETPMEFAIVAAAALRARTGCEPVAEVPIAWAEAYYQDRFGGIPASATRLAELASELARLRVALETRV